MLQTYGMGKQESNRPMKRVAESDCLALSQHVLLRESNSRPALVCGAQLRAGSPLFMHGSRDSNGSLVFLLSPDLEGLPPAERSALGSALASAIASAATAEALSRADVGGDGTSLPSWGNVCGQSPGEQVALLMHRACQSSRLACHAAALLPCDMMHEETALRSRLRCYLSYRGVVADVAHQP